MKYFYLNHFLKIHLLIVLIIIVTNNYFSDFNFQHSIHLFATTDFKLLFINFLFLKLFNTFFIEF